MIGLTIRGTSNEVWMSGLQNILEIGLHSFDGGVELREVLNLTAVVDAVSTESLIAVGASEERISLMRRKYQSLDIVEPYTRSYGALFRSLNGVNQISYLVAQLTRKPETKAATICFHQPGEQDLSCISMLDCKLRDDQLNVTAVYRSQNFFGSFPGNLIALSELRDEVAGRLASQPGTLTLHVCSAHVYATDIPEARSVVSGLQRREVS